MFVLLLDFILMTRPDLDDSKKDKKPKPNRHKIHSETVTTSGIIVPRDIVNLQGVISGTRRVPVGSLGG